MELKNIILHQILRKEDEVPDLNLSTHTLSDNETVKEFVENLVKSYGSKNPTLGTFEEDITVYPFQGMVKSYLEDSDFIKFTTESMGLLKKELQVPNATGGYVAFVHYEYRQREYIITVMLDNSIQFAVDDNSLDLEKLKTLDIDKLARANRIDLKKWEDNEDLYLSFIKGTREVSVYFQKFIGTTDITSAKKNVTIINDAVTRYCRENNIQGDDKFKILDDLYAYFELQLSNDEDVELDSISSIISPQTPNHFKSFLTDNEIEVSGKFRTTKKDDFKNIRRRTIKEKGYILSFEKSLLKTGKIIKDGNNIVITNVPDEILNKEFDE